MYIKEMPSPSPFNISPAVLYDSAYKIQAPILKNKTRKIVINVIFLISFLAFRVFSFLNILSKKICLHF